MAKHLYYKKVQTGGRPRYEPVSEYDSEVLDSIPYNRTTLIHSYKNGQSRKFDIDPALAPMVAASMVLSDSLTKILSEASKYKPSQVPITQEQWDAWDRMQEAFGGGPYTLQGLSLHDISDNILKAISDEAQKLLTNEAVKASYEEFLLIAALSKQHDISTKK